MPTPLNPTPLINGRRYDFGTVEVLVTGRRSVGCKAISYKRSLKPGEARGTTPSVIGTTTGQESNEGSIELYKEDWRELKQILNAMSGGRGYGVTYFPIVVTYGDDIDPNPSVDELLNCRITEAEDSHQAGEEPLTVKCNLFIQRVVEDGVSIVSTAF